MPLSPADAKRILAKRNIRAFNPEALFDPNFSKQVDFIKDPAKLKALFCTRRAAKSYTAGLYMVYEALTNPGINCLFLGLTRASAKGIIWKDILKVINSKYKLNATFNSTELTMTLPNKSVISVTGADADEDEMNKLLGRKYRLVCVDEASMYTINMTQLVYGVLKPAMTDPNSGGQRGTICMMGTASNFTRGLFHDISIKKEEGWKLFTWTAHDNPYVAKQWQEELDEIDTQRPLFKDTNLYKQWYLNQWVVDTNKLVYKFDHTRNTYKDLPNLTYSGWVYILGVDTGWEDDNAFVLTAYHAQDKNLYIVKTFNQSHMVFESGDPTNPGVVEKIKEFLNDKDMTPMKVIIDGANKQGVESMKQRSLIPFEYAEKQGKVDFIEILNGDLIQAKIKINERTAKPLIDEMTSLVWKTNGELIVHPKVEHPALPNHLCDAFLYAWRCGYHYAFQKTPDQPKPGSKEWAAQEEDRMRTAIYERIKAEQEERNNMVYQDPESFDVGKWRRR